MLATRLSEQEEHWGAAGTKAAFPAFSPFPAGETVAVPSLSFLPSALAVGASSLPGLHFLCRAQVPHSPSCCCPFPGLARAACPCLPLQLQALHLCFPFANVFLCLLFSGAFAFSREGAMPFQPSSFSFLPWCLPWCSCPCFFQLFYSRSSLSCDTSLQTRTRNYTGKQKIEFKCKISTCRICIACFQFAAEDRRDWKEGNSLANGRWFPTSLGSGSHRLPAGWHQAVKNMASLPALWFLALPVISDHISQGFTLNAISVTLEGLCGPWTVAVVRYSQWRKSWGGKWLMLQEAALRAFAEVQKHCETRLEKHFAILTRDDIAVAAIQHGTVIRDTAFLSPSAITAWIAVCRYCYKHIWMYVRHDMPCVLAGCFSILKKYEDMKVVYFSFSFLQIHEVCKWLCLI